MTKTYQDDPAHRPSCGSMPGHDAHRAANERDCEPCAEAYRQYRNGYHIRTGYRQSVKIPVEVLGDLFRAIEKQPVLQRLVDALGLPVIEACVARLDATVDEEVVERAIGRAENWEIREADRFQAGRPLTPAEQLVVARRLAERGHGTNAISKACRVTGTAAKQLHQEVTAA